MANFRALTVQNGVSTQIQDANTLIVGAGVTTNTGALGLSGASNVVSLLAGNSLTAAAGAGALDFSAASGVFKTTTGAVTIGPGAVGLSGNLTTGAGVSITASAGAGYLDFSAATGVFKTSTGAVTIGPGAVSISGNVTTAAGVSITASAGAGYFDFSAATGIFKTPTGAVTIGPGAVSITGIQTLSSGLVLGGSTEQNVSVNGLTTTALTTSGSFGYISSDSTLALTDNSQISTARVFGAYEAVSGQMVVGGLVADAQFTTVGGSPSPGAPVYLASATDDTDTGAGKLTATAPSTVGSVVAEVGICVNNSNYAGAKTAQVLLQPKTVIQL
jgi:hypothetical protein